MNLLMRMAPARWQSSQRPLLVRTVWMDGQRHAVLSADDPALQYLSSSNSPSGGRFAPGGSASPPNSPPPQPPGRPPAATDNDLKHCLVKLQLLRSRVRARTAAPDASSATRRPPSPPRALAPQRSNDCDERSAPYVPEALGASHLMIGRYRRPYLPCIFRCRSTSSDSSEDPDDPFLDADGWLPHVEAFMPELQMNPLSERVLQWLDLAGRGPLMASGTAKAIPAPPGRSSAAPPRRPPPSAWSRSKSRPTAVALTPQTPLPMAEPSLRCRPCGRSLVDHPAVSGGSSPDSSPPASEALLVHARGFSAHRRPSLALCTVAVSPPVPSSPPVSPPCPSPPTPMQSPERPHPTPVMQAFVPPPQPAYAPRYSGNGRGGTRPQLHIFLPALPHERQQLLLQEMESDTESLWSEA